MQQILITGISSELGGVLAENLAVDSSRKIIGTMRRKVSDDDIFPTNVEIVDECDLTKIEDSNRIAALVDDRFSGPFGLVHSVGDFWDHVPFLDFTTADADQMFASHVSTYYNLMQSIIPIMRKRKSGSCISFSCNSVRYNYPWMASFTAAKSAVESLTRSLSNEYSGDGLRFNTLVLASVKTRKVVDSKPHGDTAHFIPPEKITPIVEFLLSEQSYLMNGNSIALFEHSDQFFNEGYFDRIRR